MVIVEVDVEPLVTVRFAVNVVSADDDVVV